MSAGIAEESTRNAECLAEILAEVRRQGEILDKLAALLPAMHKAAAFLDNPVARYRDALKARKND